jgi:hypothetical protein
VSGPSVVCSGQRQPLHESGVRWREPRTGCLPSRQVLTAICDLLPIVADEVAADLLERVALTLLERDEDLLTAREMLRASMACLHEAHRTICRLENRRNQLLEQSRVLAGARRELTAANLRRVRE